MNQAVAFTQDSLKIEREACVFQPPPTSRAQPLDYRQTPSSPAEAEALTFADAWMTYAREQVQRHGTDFAPTVHFLPGAHDRGVPGGGCAGCAGNGTD